MSGTEVVLTSDGDHVVGFRSCDAAGNLEIAKSVRVRKDATAPTLVATSPVVVGAGVAPTVTFVADDALSPNLWVGLRVVRAAPGRRPVCLVRATLFASASPDAQTYLFKAAAKLRPGHYRVLLSAADLAGNRAAAWLSLRVRPAR